MQKLIVRIILTLQKAGDVALWQRLLASRAGLVLFPGACGALTSLGFAPVAVWPFTLAGLSLLFFLLQHARSKKAVFVSTLAFYGVYNTITLWWLNFVMEDFGQLPALLSILIVVLFALYLALPYALLNALAVKLSRGHKGILCMTLLPAAMILSDTVTYYLFTGFPWTYPGYACLTGPLSAFAPLLGVRGINLLLALCAGSIALSVSRQFIYLPAAGVIFMCGVFLSGLEYTDNQAPAKAALVQGNIEQSVKWNPEMTLPTLQRYLQLSAPYIRDNALVVWPESAIPLFMERSPRLLSELNSLI